MPDETRDADVLNTWTDALNAELQSLGLLLSGLDATSILCTLGRGPVLDVLRAAREAEVARLTEAANRYCETDKIEQTQIRRAIDRTVWHWRSA